MKSKFQMLLSAITFFAGLALLFAALALPLRLAAQHNQGHHHYRLIDMGTFGGPESYVNETIFLLNGQGDLNGRGLVLVGASTSIPTTPTSNFIACTGGLGGGVPFVFHAFEWEMGVASDLGTL